MADIVLTPTSTVGDTNVYQINGLINESTDRRYIQLNDTSNWLIGIQTNIQCQGVMFSSLENITNLYSLGNIANYTFPTILIRSTRFWITNLSIPLGGTLIIETKTTI